MMAKRLWCLLLLAVAATGVACDRGPLFEETLHESSSFGFSYEGELTDEQMDAVMDALANGTPLPSYVTSVDYGGSLVGALTGGVRLSTGELEFTVTLDDDAADLDQARLFVDGREVDLATVANGGVTVDGDLGVAVLTGHAKPVRPLTVRVDWQGPGSERPCSSEVTFE